LLTGSAERGASKGRWGRIGAANSPGLPALAGRPRSVGHPVGSQRRDLPDRACRPAGSGGRDVPTGMDRWPAIWQM